VTNGSETAQFKCGLIRRMKRGGGANDRQMWCRARGSGSMAAGPGWHWPAVEAGSGGAPLFRGEGGRRGRGWAKRPNRPAERLS
jgi:hypothetical protein